MPDLAIYPGGDLVEKGLIDLEEGRLTEEALLVALAATRLRGLGLDVPALPTDDPNHALFERIEARLPRGAHAAYNSLIERIVSFANAYRG